MKNEYKLNKIISVNNLNVELLDITYDEESNPTSVAFNEVIFDRRKKHKAKIKYNRLGPHFIFESNFIYLHDFIEEE